LKVSVKKEFDLTILLNELQKYLTLNCDGTITTTNDFTIYRDLKDLLVKSLILPEAAKHLDLEVAAGSSIRRFLAGSDKTEKQFIEILLKTCKEELSKKEEAYTVLTSISLSKSNLQSFQFELNECKIAFHNEVPKKLKGRPEVIAKHIAQLTPGEMPGGYTVVTMEVKSRYVKEAFDRAMDTLDVLRALINHDVNLTALIIGDAWKPINKVRYGRIHTIHNSCGLALDTQIYFEPGFKEATPLNYLADKSLLKNIKFYLQRIKGLPYSRKIFLALQRYVRALDESDNNIAVVKLWATLETLLLEHGEDCARIAPMVSALCSNPSLERLFIENIRIYRNTHIHTGSQDDSPIHYSYQLQGWFRLLFAYYVRGNHTSLVSANKDLKSASEGREKIESKIEQLQIVLLRFNEVLS
jgi:hypothetical protein